MGFGQGTGRDYLMSHAGTENAEWAFAAYEATRHRLPVASFPMHSRKVGDLSELADDIDLFLLDAFGVLNTGDQVIPGAPQRVAQLRDMGKKVLVVSNAAGYPKRNLLAHYHKLGFDFAPEDVLSSREVLLAALSDLKPLHFGLMASEEWGRDELDHLGFEFLGDDPAVYDRAERIVMLGSGAWSDHRQGVLEASLIARPRPVLVGNPDIVAPRVSGLSREPGYYAHRIADLTGIVPQFFGKPFGPVFERALARAGQGIDPARIVMVGDTLQTDILGGRAAGLKTALITGFGALRGMDADGAIARSGIVPDYVMAGP
jgi:glycerol 3-phosphatase-2